jgi:cation diffusion facilitator family transporter
MTKLLSNMRKDKEQEDSFSGQLSEPRFSDERVVKTSVGVDVVDVCLNALVALATGSVVMLAEVLRGISDVVVDGLAYVGMRRSKRQPTAKHPFGFGRELYVWSLFSTLIMFLFLASLSFRFGLQRFLDPEPVEHISLIFFILTVSFLINGYSFSLGFRRVLQGRPFWKIRQALSQPTFLETKITFTSDLMGALTAVSGLIALVLFKVTGNLAFDGLGAMTIGLLMAFFSLWLLKNIRDFIVGVSAPEETKAFIRQAVLEIAGVEDVLDMKAIVIGSNRLLVNLEIHVKDGLVTDEIERLIDRVKDNIKKKVTSAYHIQVELETPDVEIK